MQGCQFQADDGEIEVRYAETEYRRGRIREEFDEIVAFNATVHLEKLSDGEFALIIETKTEQAGFAIFTKNRRAHLDAVESWRVVGCHDGNPHRSSPHASRR
jgi:hypothetical protein